MVQLGERGDAGVGNLDDAEVPLVTLGGIARFDGDPGERAEYGALATARQPDETDLHGEDANGRPSEGPDPQAGR